MSYVGARDGIPVPTKPYERAPKATWVVCGRCPWRGRPGGFHVCVEPSETEPTAEPVPSPKYALAAKRLKEMKEMYAGGSSLTEIAAELGMSYSGVQKAMSQAGVPRRPQGRNRDKGSAA